ncbi:hypothetical protein GZH46_03036 [Fragariocoptes setiger]|uniref:Gustatory receptor n=1 Tax=Fragariocoptes setiger TaxID=1670756 RepID=A0ABQ7S543_9ACAR|nr:hypothetical protein GZH46_03036 [Fragariocoptes setiger]
MMPQQKAIQDVTMKSMASNRAKESCFSGALRRLIIFAIEAAKLLVFNYVLSVNIDDIIRKPDRLLSSTAAIATSQQRQEEQNYCYNNNRFKKFMLNPIVSIVRTTLLLIVLVSQIFILKSDSMSESYWVGDVMYFNGLSWPNSTMTLVLVLTSLASLASRRLVPNFEIEMLNKSFDDAKLYANSYRRDTNQILPYSLSSSNDAYCRRACWLFVFCVIQMVFYPTGTLMVLLASSLTTQFQLPIHGVILQLFTITEGCITVSLSFLHCSSMTNEMSARVKNVRNDLEETISEQHLYSKYRNHWRSKSSLVALNDSLIRESNFLLNCYKINPLMYRSWYVMSHLKIVNHERIWNCSPDCDDQVCKELRLLGFHLAHVMNRVTRSNDYWKWGFAILIGNLMGLAVLCACFAINATNSILLWLLVSGVVFTWILIVLILLAGSITNGEITEMRLILLRRLRQIDEPHRFLAFRLYDIVSDTDIGYTVFDFFQITHRAAFILLGWFASAIALILTYGEEIGGMQFSSRKNDFVNNAPRPFW